MPLSRARRPEPHDFRGPVTPCSSLSFKLRTDRYRAPRRCPHAQGGPAAPPPPRPARMSCKGAVFLTLAGGCRIFDDFCHAAAPMGTLYVRMRVMKRRRSHVQTVEQ